MPPRKKVSAPTTEPVNDEPATNAVVESAPTAESLAPGVDTTGDLAIPVAKVCPHCGTEYETVARFCPADGTALKPKGADTLIGHILADKYHILKRIGEGGMGRVYLGEHVKMSRQCAIKVMSPALLNDAESAARFAREASNAARIIHPNVAAVFDYGESDGVIYLVMEYVEGEPLARILKREAPLALDRAIDIASQIADGLGAAHELHIIHRDLKPDNILIARNRAGREVVKVVDFGIAKAMQEGESDSLTRTGHVIGTPEFMSPEQLLGDPVDARSDLYALGCILHLMLTAAPPLFAPTREQMIKRRLAEEAPTVEELDGGLPETIANIVARLLARSPADRYSSAIEVRDALAGTHVRRGAPVQAKLTKATPRSAPTVAFLQATQATTEITSIPPSQPVRRMPFIVGGIVLAVVVAGVIMKGVPDPVGAERATSISRDSVAKAANITAGMDSAAARRAMPSVPLVPMVDSVRQAEKAAAKRRDSTARLANAGNDAVHSPIARFARAIEQHDVTAMRAAYPGLTSRQQDSWKNFFERAESISAPVRFGVTKITGDSAQVDFRLMVVSVLKDTKQKVPSPLRQHATLLKLAEGWEIVALR
jgi:serine/threonine protein kinase